MTSYELRISDWSSDVCSSDLRNFGVTSVAPPKAASSRTAMYSLIARLAASGGNPAGPSTPRWRLASASIRPEDGREGHDGIRAVRYRWSQDQYKQKSKHDAVLT